MTDKQKEKSAEETAESLLEVVRQLAAELQPGRRQLSSVTLDSSLDRDLGLDSPARVELLIRIEQTFEVMLSEQVLASAETPRDLLRAVLSAGSPRRPLITPDLVKPVALEKTDAAAHSAQTLVEVLDWHVLSHPDRPHILLYGEADHTVEITYRALKQGAGKFNPPPLQPQDTAFLQYTSGSTGDPKGVVLTHANLLANIRAMGEAVEVDSTDVFVSWLPLYHDMGLIGAWFGSLYYACQLVLMSPLAFKDQTGLLPSSCVTQPAKTFCATVGNLIKALR